MKQILGLFFLVLVTFGHSQQLNIAVSILPQKTFVEAIGKDKVKVTLMVEPGSSPHSYEPKPSQMKALGSASAYFTIGVEFESVWLPRFASQNKTMRIVNTTEGITRLPIAMHHHGDHHDHGTLDPHIWTSPSNVKIISKNIKDALVDSDPKNKHFYEENYTIWVEYVDSIDSTIRANLERIKDGKFMVFHPAWGYFAHEYGLTQVAIEIEGKEPKPKQVASLIKKAKEEDIKAVFVAPEFSQKVAAQIAKELGVPVVALSPLDPKWGENLIQLSHAISNH